MNYNLLSRVGLLLGLATLTACKLPSNQLINAQKPNQGDRPANIQQTNLIGLSLVKKDNLTNEYRGEIYPIALLINGRYVDVSTDVTTSVRDNLSEDVLLRNFGNQSLLSAVQNFTVLNQGEKLGEFQVQKLGISQFACSTKLTGQGNFSGERSLEAVFNSLPEDQVGGFSGSIGDKQFDESWRWTIALSQYNPAKNAIATPDATAEAKYRQDLTSTANAFFSIDPQVKNVTGETVVEEISVVDLDQDGQPEIYGLVRKGADPKNESSRGSRNGGVVGAYANVWLTYDGSQPRHLANKLTPYSAIAARPAYDLITTVDINGDGIQEAIVRNIGYESTSFGIYEYQGNQLKQVFSGAGYGC
ncbi:hypothetical protein NDA01_20860 [Trichocoleus desertorum AS-A10]|uniref:hypothetical protein n=1 Tax=Trichocoleus desertorum TaxID=1481672 RepID=UPI003299FC4D